MMENLINIKPIFYFFNRSTVKNDIDYMYLFTDNSGRTSGKNSISPCWYTKKYGINGNYPTMTQAVIRGLDNAYPITTMVDDKRNQWSDDLFEEYKSILDNEIEEIKNNINKYKGIKYSASNPFGVGKYSNMRYFAPKCWDYLNIKLKEININNI